MLAEGYGIAVLGNIFTHPDARGQSLATAVTARLAADLLGRGCSDVVLNVHASNDAAIRVYTRLGFRTYSRFLIGQTERLSEWLPVGTSGPAHAGARIPHGAQ